ncbi:30S ribosomal protein S20 [Helicovermis profundi]|uniref:Small ribosomal subunit protein bS20 n=1 Tax=Helicovermis profundi TaxID=3065157 RepID=A0AAU9EA76_9FIRM|nr:30S ribosomal protein S20 [Clostridia bacterium S502]
MANIKSAKKRIKVISKKTLNNKSKKSALKTAEKKFLEAVEAGDKALATDSLKSVEKQIRKATTKNILHLNTASRKVSRLTSKLNKMA